MAKRKVREEDIKTENIQAESIKTENIQAESIKAENIQAESIKAENIQIEKKSQECLTGVINHGVTPFHVVKTVKEKLAAAGFEELQYGMHWNVEEGGAYYVSPYPSMVVAVTIGKWNEDTEFRIASAHTDSPCLKVKSNPELPGKKHGMINVEPYGGLLKKTWFDRPLAMAGKVIVKGKDAFHPQTILVDSGTPICVIPNLAPHLSRGMNDKEMNVQKELIPIGSLAETPDFLQEYIRKLVSEQTTEEILDYDLYLYNPEQVETVGVANEMISAPRIDNLASVSALLEAMMERVEASATVSDTVALDVMTGKKKKTSKSKQLELDHKICIAAMFDHEEIGSRSKQGADSTMLTYLLDCLRAGLHQEVSEEQWKQRLMQGFLLSMDGAQGYHPNYPETNDPTNPVYMGKGVVIKTSASERYLSDSEASAIVKSICRAGDIPCQTQVNKSGMPGGQTLGPILVATLPLQGADVGIPMLAMHSARELAAWSDYEALVKLAKAFYQA